MKEEAENWLNQAEEDLETAKYNFNGKRFSAAAFFAQQSAEKALKALLLSKGHSLIKIHDLVKLARILKAPTLIVEKCADLNPAYIATRYPEVIKGFVGSEVGTLLSDAEEAVEWTKKSL